MKRLFVFVSLIIYAFSNDVWKACEESCENLIGNQERYINCVIECIEDKKLN